ncbi:MAG: hypothetical protein COU33_01340 [Candidatus Magasanikbacteria bacterium CG10_big_fil_rev_8_21_14_0_10_43_6]|uniref:NYN domain-containing protein n=1 Tax=Candidatus Magasanikbacteria bacterium CG10_big_fil_rev_8_21_14_0_10_43_6 TaxID=1974650 RepID=A0A2M6W1T5_9BACT|nr:MAG: hypothetical protein COU33_01340 [Candidatus Magasanikbacteria bacterium CG10_big_fil_rev_8_21_14_0_10_43_6]
MKLKRKNKIAIFVDAGNLWSSYKKIGRKMDMNKLVAYMEERYSGSIFKVFYYVAYPTKGTRPQETIKGIHSYLTFLKKGLGFEVVKKPLKRIFLKDADDNIIINSKNGEPEVQEKGNLDVEFAIDAVRYSSAYNTAIFLTGDSDFLPLVSFLRNQKNPKKVFVFSTEGCISHELKTGGDGYVDLKQCSELFLSELERKK